MLTPSLWSNLLSSMESLNACYWVGWGQRGGVRSSSPRRLWPVLYAKVPYTISLTKQVLQLRKPWWSCFDSTPTRFLEWLFPWDTHRHGRCDYMVCSANVLLGVSVYVVTLGQMKPTGVPALWDGPPWAWHTMPTKEAELGAPRLKSWDTT